MKSNRRNPAGNGPRDDGFRDGVGIAAVRTGRLSPAKPFSFI
jgi:hypothetical protein